MPWPVYSERLLQAGGLVGWTTALVPAGTRLVMNDVIISNGGAVTGLVQISLGGRTVFIHDLLASQPSLHFERRSVAYQGEQLAVYTPATTVGVVVCGFIFLEAVRATALPSMEPVEHPGIPPATGWEAPF